MYEHSTNSDKVLQLVELGPGRGTLMNDIIRVSDFCVFQNKRKFLDLKVLRKQKYSDTNTFIVLYEASPLMRRRQAETLLGRSVFLNIFIEMQFEFFLFYKFDPIITNDYRIPDGNYSLIWIDDFKQLHSHNTYFIANELFDAYPIHKFQVEYSSIQKKN
jgi:SAM-dependent MidA family methyltransferase